MPTSPSLRPASLRTSPPTPRSPSPLAHSESAPLLVDPASSSESDPEAVDHGRVHGGIGPANEDADADADKEQQEADMDRALRAHGWDLLRRWDLGPTGLDRLALGGLVIGGLLFVVGTWFMVFKQDIKALGYFTPHPLLNSLSLLALFLGIIPLQPPPPTAATRRARFAAHQRLILALALPGLAAGSASMWWNKHVHGAAHFTTWHAWCGVASLGWIVVQSLLGLASVHLTSVFGGPEKAKRVYKYHRLSGYALVCLLAFTAHLGGAHSSWAVGLRGMRGVRVGAFWVGLGVMAGAVLVRMRPSKMQLRAARALH